ncbi:hypothetical protein QE152_g29894 [Popillia japonica]|uniref:Uncharacterized protein n=1 Tax=Popillia japonica TaxID=7064 RepID=A0AAW1JGR2_POPJA
MSMQLESEDEVDFTELQLENIEQSEEADELEVASIINNNNKDLCPEVRTWILAKYFTNKNGHICNVGKVINKEHRNQYFQMERSVRDNPTSIWKLLNIIRRSGRIPPRLLDNENIEH